MPTTSKLGLYLPEGDDLARDIDLSVNDQMKIIDNNFKVEIVPTFADLPVAPYDGQLGYIEDNQELYYWNALNVAWVYILGRKDGWGKKFYEKKSTASEEVGKNQEKGPYITATYNQQEGRIYRVSWNVETDSPGGGDFGDNYLRIRYKLSNSVGVADQLLYWMWIDHMTSGGTNSCSHSGDFTYTAESTGQISLGMFLARGNVSVNDIIYFSSGHDNNLMVEDVGWSDQ